MIQQILEDVDPDSRYMLAVEGLLNVGGKKTIWKAIILNTAEIISTLTETFLSTGKNIRNKENTLI